MAAALARVCLPARPPMCCTTPNGIAPCRRGRIARYNGPLHNGIRTCDIPGGRRRDAAHDTGVAKEALSSRIDTHRPGPLGTASHGISHVTRFSCIRAPVSSRCNQHRITGSKTRNHAIVFLSVVYIAINFFARY